MRPLAVFALLSACSDYELKSGSDATEEFSDTSTPPDSGTPAPVEECNGLDDDGDGHIDEDFPDGDGDGVADCEEVDCEVELAPAADIAIDSACLGGSGGEVTDPWDLTIEWQYNSGGSGVIVMPAVGNLTDDNGDGQVDDDDIPDVAFTGWSTGQLVAVNGDDGSVIFALSGYDGNAGVTIADVDADGFPEVVAATTGDRVVAVSGTGTVEWTSAQFSSLSMYPQPAVADLDNDGMPEVIMDVAVLNGENGTTVATLSGLRNSWRTPVAADIDQDGTQEIILANGVFSHTGVLEWSNSGSGAGNFAAVAEIDGDVGGEVFFVSGSTGYIHDDDGTLLSTFSIPGSNPGPPSVADFDGDGTVEIGVPANSYISVFELDGTRNWSQPINDSSGLAGCSGYDMNGDGAYELLFADQDHLYIYDGATGTIQYSNGTHSSGTVWEYPVIADVDGDGSAEIIIASNGGTWTGITVFGHAGDGWPQSGPTWGTHDFAVTNLGQDGSVPSPPEASWLVHNVFRARPAVDQPDWPDLYIELVDTCVGSCIGGPIKLSWQVGNSGGMDVEPGAVVALYLVDTTGARTLFDTHVMGAIPAGRAAAGGSFELEPRDLRGGGFVLAVDDDGAVEECNEANNEEVYADAMCGG